MRRLHRTALAGLGFVTTACVLPKYSGTMTSIESGTLPRSFYVGAANCAGRPDFLVHAYNPDFYILRQSACSNFEKPLLFLIFGSERALLLDTGAGKVDVAGAVRLSCDLLGLGSEPIAYDVVTPDRHRSAQQRAASSPARLRHRIRNVPAAVPARVRRALGRGSSSP